MRISCVVVICAAPNIVKRGYLGLDAVQRAGVQQLRSERTHQFLFVLEVHLRLLHHAMDGGSKLRQPLPRTVCS